MAIFEYLIDREHDPADLDLAVLVLNAAFFNRREFLKALNNKFSLFPIFQGTLVAVMKARMGEFPSFLNIPANLMREEEDVVLATWPRSDLYLAAQPGMKVQFHPDRMRRVNDTGCVYIFRRLIEEEAVSLDLDWVQYLLASDNLRLARVAFEVLRLPSRSSVSSMTLKPNEKVWLNITQPSAMDSIYQAIGRTISKTKDLSFLRWCFDRDYINFSHFDFSPIFFSSSAAEAPRFELLKEILATRVQLVDKLPIVKYLVQFCTIEVFKAYAPYGVFNNLSPLAVQHFNDNKKIAILEYLLCECPDVNVSTMRVPLFHEIIRLKLDHIVNKALDRVPTFHPLFLSELAVKAVNSSAMAVYQHVVKMPGFDWSLINANKELLKGLNHRYSLGGDSALVELLSHGVLISRAPILKWAIVDFRPISPTYPIRKGVLEIISKRDDPFVWTKSDYVTINTSLIASAFVAPRIRDLVYRNQCFQFLLARLMSDSSFTNDVDRELFFCLKSLYSITVDPQTMELTYIMENEPQVVSGLPPDPLARHPFKISIF